MTAPVPSLDDLLPHRDFVRAMAGAVLGADDRVDDVEQETWLAALRYAPGVRSMRSWLGSVSRNRALRELRSASRRGDRERRASELPPADASDPATILEREETRRRLLDALLSLDDPYRATLLLRYDEGLSPPEIARRMETPLETVRTRLKRGLTRLRRAFLEREAQDDRRGLPALLSLATMPTRSASVVLGGVAVKKSLAWALALLLLFAGGGGLMSVWSGARNEDPPEPDAALTSAAIDHQPTLEPQAPLDVPVVDSNGWQRGPVVAFGVVVDEAGEPIAGAEVRTFDFRGARFFSRHVAAAADAVTDAEGRFQIRSPGRGWLHARAQGYVAAEWATSGPRAPTRIVLVRPTGRIQGTIRAHGGGTLAGAWIRVFSIEGEARAWGRSRADGRFDISFVRHGEIYASAWAPGHLELSRVPLPRADVGGVRHVALELEPAFRVRGRVIDKESGAPILGAEIVSLERFGPVPRTDVDGRFEFVATARMPFVRAEAPGYTDGRGELTFDADGNATASTIAIAPLPTLSGIVVDEQGDPVEGALVGHGTSFGSAMERVVTGLDGSFTLRGLGTELFALHDEHGLAVVHVEGTGPFTLSFKGSHRVLGRVVDSEGQPVSGAALMATPPDRVEVATGVSVAAGLLSMGVAVSGPDGRFETTALPDGRYRLTAFAPPRIVAYRASVLLDVPGAKEVEIRLEPGTELHGRIEDAEGNPVPGAVIEASDPGESSVRFHRLQPKTTSGEDGSFRLVGIPRHALGISVRAEGFRPFQRTMTPGSEPLDVVLVPRRRVCVRITENPPPEGSELMARFAGGGGGSAFYVNGEVIVGIWSDGVKSVRLAWRGQVSEPIPISFEEGQQTLRASVAMPAPRDPPLAGAAGPAASPIDMRTVQGVVKGRVVPVPPGGFFGVMVFAGRSNRTVRQDGGFEMRMVPGRVSFWCGTWAAKGAKQTVKVEAGKTVSIELAAPEGGGSIRGRVVTRQDAGVGGLSLVARQASSNGHARGEVFMFETDANGRFALHYLQGDRYEITGADARGSVEVQLPAGTVDAPIRLAGNGTLRGLVTGDLPSDPQKIRIHVDRADLPDGKSWSTSVSLQPDKRGFYFELPVPPGRYRFRLASGDPVQAAYVPPSAERVEYATLGFDRTPPEVEVIEGEAAAVVRLELRPVR